MEVKWRFIPIWGGEIVCAHSRPANKPWWDGCNFNPFLYAFKDSAFCPSAVNAQPFLLYAFANCGQYVIDKLAYSKLSEYNFKWVQVADKLEYITESDLFIFFFSSLFLFPFSFIFGHTLIASRYNERASS